MIPSSPRQIAVEALAAGDLAAVEIVQLKADRLWARRWLCILGAINGYLLVYLIGSWFVPSIRGTPLTQDHLVRMMQYTVVHKVFHNSTYIVSYPTGPKQGEYRYFFTLENLKEGQSFYIDQDNRLVIQQQKQ